MFLWPIMNQTKLRGVSGETLLRDGYFRKHEIDHADIYVDMFRKKYPLYGGTTRKQFIMQLNGVQGLYTSKEVADFYNKSGCDVFTLLNGERYMMEWPELLKELKLSPFRAVVTLNEIEYCDDWLCDISCTAGVMLEVLIEGENAVKYLNGEFDISLMEHNLGKLMRWNVPYYIIVTDISDATADEFAYKFPGISKLSSKQSMPHRLYDKLYWPTEIN